MTMREEVIKEFLEKSGFGDASIAPLAGDASFRSYRRLSMGGKTFVLMDAPPDHEDVRPFMAASDYLNGLGLSAPKILNNDIENGLLVLEDFGDEKFNTVLDQSPEKSQDFYSAAIDVLVPRCSRLRRPPPLLPAGAVADRAARTPTNVEVVFIVH